MTKVELTESCMLNVKDTYNNELGGRFFFVIWKIHVHRFRVRETRFAERKKN